MQSDLGLTPNNDGKVIRLQVPQLTAVSPRGGAKEGLAGCSWQRQPS
jgi:ribosome recycling factor